MRPLFFDGPREQDESLPRASSRLARELRRELARLRARAGMRNLPPTRFTRRSKITC
ncbi:MAG: hypothetical protein WKF30_04550 [Pyrinomonadaceae bacterium]